MFSIIAFLLQFFTANLAGILVGLFIGWTIPMPSWAATLYSSALSWFWGLFKSAFSWLWGKITTGL